MTPNQENIDDVLKRALSSASTEEMESARARIFQSLNADNGAAVVYPLRDFSEPRRFRSWQLASVAAAILLAVTFGLIWQQRAFAVVESVDGTLYQVIEGRPSALQVGERLSAGATVRSEGNGRGALKLSNGARVEVGSESELSLEERMRISLKRGGVLVEGKGAVPVVQTKELTVPIAGKAFVTAQEGGSRVAVLEGEARVQQGATEKNLRSGEQLSTSPDLGVLNTDNVAALMARLSFEVATIRPTNPSYRPPPGARGGGGAGPHGCANGLIQVDPRLFVMNGVSLQALISFAYPEWSRPRGGCTGVSSTKLLSGGPEWVRTDQWDIQATIPEGTSTATNFQYVSGNAPNVDRMLQTLLEDRFRLVLRRETKEIPVHFLTVAKDGPRFNGLRPDNGRGRAFSQDENGYLIEVPREDIKGRIAAQRSVGVQAYRVTMADWAKTLSGEDGLPVLDKTGLTGEYSFYFDRDPAGHGLLSRQEEIGLKIEDGKALMEVWVIERAEKPSEN